MIFYFSGTGNSKYIARKLSEFNDDKLISIAEEMINGNNNYEYELKENETIAIVYPIYAWAPPKPVLDFVKKLKLNNYNENYIYTVATCGENIGDAIGVLSKALEKNNYRLNSGFSIAMPNNYIIMGDIDSKDIQNKKVEEANKTIEEIRKIVESRSSIFHVEKGAFPKVLTKIINPVFNKFAIDASKFKVSDKCIGCKKCERICNTKNIKVDGKPVWGNNCCQCLACLHCCPTRAIDYGKSTEKKGRYFFNFDK